MIILYIIETHYNTYYTGITNSNIRRWKEHNNRKGKYLSKYKPKAIIHQEYFNTRKEARQQEIAIKRTGAKKYILKLKYIQNNPSNNNTTQHNNTTTQQ